MRFTDKIKTEIRTRYDMDLVGVAAASALAGEPKGHRPEDILPGAKSILVFGRSFSDGAVQAMFRGLEENKGMVKGGYGSYCDELAPNFLLINDAFRISCWLEDSYRVLALPCPFNVLQSMIWDYAPGKYFADPYGQGMPLDIYKAALAAGLGEFGWSNRFLTPEYGPRQMFTAVLTTLELEPDAPYSGPKLCDPEKCGVCARLCPTHAISEPCGGCAKTVAVEGKSQTVSAIKPNACAVAAVGYRREFGGMLPVPDVVDSNDPTDEEMKAGIAKKPISELGIEHFPRWNCDRCLVYCPAGNWKAHFSDTGLSSFDPDGEKAK